MKAKRKVRPRIEFIPPIPHVKAKPKEEEEEDKESLYKITVKTGNKPNAATSANVSSRVFCAHTQTQRGKKSSHA